MAIELEKVESFPLGGIDIGPDRDLPEATNSRRGDEPHFRGDQSTPGRDAHHRMRHTAEADVRGLCQIVLGNIDDVHAAADLDERRCLQWKLATRIRPPISEYERVAIGPDNGRRSKETFSKWKGGNADIAQRHFRQLQSSCLHLTDWPLRVFSPTADPNLVTRFASIPPKQPVGELTGRGDWYRDPPGGQGANITTRVSYGAIGAKSSIVRGVASLVWQLMVVIRGIRAGSSWRGRARPVVWNLFIEEAGVPLLLAPGDFVLISAGLLIATAALSPDGCRFRVFWGGIFQRDWLYDTTPAIGIPRVPYAGLQGIGD